METRQPGVVRIAREALKTIIEKAALEVPGVMRLAPVGGQFAHFLDREGPYQGIALTTKEESVSVDLYLVVQSGSAMVEVATAVQEAVAGAIEHMVGLSVQEINVFIQDVA
jgi:uncharacterized alkaline shock family protein YloU